MQPEIQHAAPKRPSEVVHDIEGYIRAEGLPTGVSAELRRLNPRGDLSSPALNRVFARFVPAEWVSSVEGARAWALIVHFIAQQRTIQGEYASFGAAAAAADISEARFTALLRADGELRVVALVRLAKTLLAKNVRIRITDIAQYASTSKEERLADLRNRFASQFYRAEFVAAKNNSAAQATI